MPPKAKFGNTAYMLTCLEEYYTNSERFNVVSLHGNIKQSSGIYLPTEVSCETYLLEKESSEYVCQVHQVAVCSMEKAKRVVIWGCSLAEYDAELCMLLRAAAKAYEFKVIDPSKTPVKRLKALLGKNIEVEYINPLPVRTRIWNGMRCLKDCLCQL